MVDGEPRGIVMTGASGFVGRRLLQELREAFPGAAIAAGRVDVTDRDAVAAVVRETQPEVCIHLAALTSVMAARDDPDRAWRVNLHGALNVARALLAFAPDCRLVFASSAEIYGESFRAGVPLDESALPAPMNTYAATKAAADLALGAMAGEGLRVVRLRLFNHTGPGQSEAFVAPAFARQIARIEAGLQAPPLRVGGLGSQRDFLDLRDVTRAYVACVRHAADLPAGAILNIASGAPRRIGDVLQDLLELAGLQVDVVVDDRRLRKSEIVSASGDAGRARALLGWRPTIPWRQTLADLLADWRERTAAGA